MSEGRDWVRTFVVVLLVWAAVSLASATRPTTDAVPLVTPDGSVRSQPVDCNSFLSSRARDDEPLPALPEGFDYARTACEGQHGQGRLLLAVDAAFVAAALVLARRLSRARRDRSAA